MSFCTTFTVVVLGCNKDLEDSENPREKFWLLVSVAYSSIGQSSNITRFFYADFTFAVIRRRSIDRDDVPASGRMNYARSLASCASSFYILSLFSLNAALRQFLAQNT